MIQEVTTQNIATPFRLNTFFRLFLVVGSGLLISLQTIATFFSSQNFYEIFSHFQEFYFYLALFGLALSICLKNKPFMAVHAVLIAYNLILFFPYFPSLTSTETNIDTIKIYQANVLTSNTSHEQLINQVYEQNPDVVLMIETDSKWYDATSTLVKTYPHCIKSLKDNNFGFIFYSKLPIISSEIDNFDTSIDCLNILIQYKNKVIRFLGVHPPPPLKSHLFEIRNKHLLNYASIINNDKNTPAIVCGDMNITPWSYYYKKLVEDAHLNSTRNRVGILGSWPSSFFYRIPIDHCLITKHFGVVKTKVLYSINSDHMPILSEIYLKPNSDIQ